MQIQWWNILKNRLGFVWIELILLKLKTENRKHCSKIIFKCVNSTVRSIFNEKIDTKWSLWDPWAVHKCTVHKRTGQPLRPKRKKKKKKKKKKNWGNADAALISAIQTSTYLKIKLEYFLEKNCRLWELTRGVYNRRQ